MARVALATLLMAAVTACQAALDVPENARIGCATQADCPAPLQCDPLSNLCVAVTLDVETTPPNRPPAAVIGAIAGGGVRPLSSADVPITVSDPEGDAVDLQLTFSLDYDATLATGTWHPLSLQAGSTNASALAAPPAGATHTFTWDILSDARAPNKPIGTVRVDADGDPAGVPELEIADFAARATVRVIPFDASGTPGAAGLSNPIALGNRAPGVVVNTPALPISGAAIVQFRLSDSAGDAGVVELQFRPNGGTTWQPLALAFGATTGLLTAPAGVDHVVQWDSLADPGSVVLTTAQLRARAGDDVAGVTHFGPWTDPVPDLEVQNQSPPAAVDVAMPKASSDRPTGAAFITFTLFDEQSDLADVRVEFSPGPADPWSPCTEYASMLSAGRYDLPTAPLAAGGLRHRFAWDVTSDRLASAGFTRVRVIPSDLHGLGPAAVIDIPRPTGIPSSVGNASVFEPIQTLHDGIDGGTALVVADYSGDGALDFAVPETGGDTLNIVSSPTYGPARTIAIADISSKLLAADFNGDGLDDLAVLSGDPPDRINILLASAGPDPFNGVVPTVINLTMASFFVRPAAGDFDGDGADDLAVLEVSGGSVIWGNGFSVTPIPLLVGASLGAADIDRDGRDDLVVTPGGMVAELQLWLGRSDRTFDDGGVMFTEFPTDEVYFADFDGDGFSDMAARRSGSLEIFRNADAQARAPLESLGLFTGASQNRLGFGEINGDGRADVFHELSGIKWGVSAGAWMGAAEGFFMSDAGPSTLIIDLWMGDVDGDRRADRVLVGYGTSCTPACLQLALGSPQNEMTSESFALGPMIEDVGSAPLYDGVLGDFDNDGVVDVALRESSAVLFYLGLGEGGLASGRFADRTLLFPGTGESIAAADFDRDGVLDLAIGGDSVVYSLQVYLAVLSGGAGTGAFEVAQSHAQTQRPLDILAADFNRDDYPDVALVDDDRTLAIYLNLAQGDGLLDEPLLYVPSVVDPFSGLSTGDLDGDGALDIVAQHPGSAGMLSVLMGQQTAGQPDGRLGGLASYAFGSLGGGRGLAVADMNADGVLDILAMDSDAMTGSWAILQGTAAQPGQWGGTFATLTQDSGAAYAVSTVADINRDGDLDVVTGDVDAGNLTVWGRATGTQAAYGAFDPADAPRLLAGDVDGDALVDLWAPGSPGDAFLLGRRESALESWTRGMAPWDPTTGRGNVVGDVLESTLDSSGVARWHSFSQRRFAGVGDEVAPVGTWGSRRYGDFKRLLQHGPLSYPPVLVPLTDAWMTQGQRRIVRTVVPDAVESRGGERLMLAERWGPRVSTEDWDPQRAGLDLQAAMFSDQRGVIIDLPFRSDRDASDLMGGTVHVYLRTRRYRVADTHPTDALFGEAATFAPAGYLLPKRSPDGSGADHLFLLEWEWTEVQPAAGGDLTQGSGARFQIDAAGRRIRVLTDRLGTMAAFVSY